MRLTKSILIGSAATVLGALLLTLVTPKTAHAVVAALVQVANTPANPVPNTDVNAPGEEPFQTQICFSNGDTPEGCGSVPFNFTVPATTSDGITVKRLVVEQVSAECFLGGSAIHPSASISLQMNENQVNGAAFPGVIWFVPVPSGFGGPFSLYFATIAVRAYADPGTSITPFLGYEIPSSPASGTCNYTIVGSLHTH